MRPHTPTLKEVLHFISTASAQDVETLASTITGIPFSGKLIQQALFEVRENIEVLPPNNQHELVIYTLIFPPRELTINYWGLYKTNKFSSRLGEVEKKLNMVLVNRETKPFINRFGHASEYRVYVPIRTQQEYIQIYNELKANEK